MKNAVKHDIVSATEMLNVWEIESGRQPREITLSEPIVMKEKLFGTDEEYEGIVTRLMTMQGTLVKVSVDANLADGEIVIR